MFIILQFVTEFALLYIILIQGLPPKRSSFLMHALLSTHFRTGAYYPTGGSSRIANTIIPVIKAAGGAVLVRAPVSEILLDSDGTKVIGVKVRGMEVFAPIVISGCGILTTYTKLLCPEESTTSANINNKASKVQSHVNKVRSHLIPRPAYVDPDVDPVKMGAMDKLEPSSAMFCLFVGINKSAEELGINTQNRWLVSL